LAIHHAFVHELARKRISGKIARSNQPVPPHRSQHEALFGMIGLVLVTHGRLADEFRSALEHVVGPQEAIATISIAPEDDVESRRGDILKAVAEVDRGQGVVILTDMFGGTPSNLAISVMDQSNVEVLAGVNLPMLVKLARVRAELPLKATVEKAQEAGRKYINIASLILGS
jgi:mannose PTS system EIIA component